MDGWYRKAAEAIADRIAERGGFPITADEIEEIIRRVQAEWYIEMANA